ncbi:YegS/Rv2252/BmrU family lipid kinase [Halobacteria archaeon AArc-curdl1]|uniref:YegS/Rv2252/BmrU family lipid kinase n=1 Tax=Natronosalvus hydrolyticus TaxID=2979988 RepID=A0AAP2Z5Y3_9EURY|nr:YegS/Rv2252/BmrU family lipid kinase [Halobacteria archaeon AArc-curdl1]
MERSRDGKGETCRSRRVEGSDAFSSERILVLNPASGNRDHAPAVESRAVEHGFQVHETTERGDAEQIARLAANAGVSVIAVAGGDGTVHEVVAGLYDVGALAEVDCAVVPAGTANVFARRLGIADIEEGFRTIERAETRRFDVGVANDEPFVGTCLVGVTAEANTTTTDEAKRRLGVFAYARTALRLLSDYEGRPLRVTIRDEKRATDDRWSGDVFLLLVGNAAGFPAFRGLAATNPEDGRFDVLIVEDRPTADLLDPRTMARLFDDGPITRREGSALTIAARRSDSVPFSLDGELRLATEIEVRMLAQRLSVYVGRDYDLVSDY